MLMAWMRSISKIFRKKSFDEKVDEFLGDRLKDVVQQKIQEGMSPDDALKAVHIEAALAVIAAGEADREAHATPEALQRRQSSESILRAEGVPLTEKPLPTLPTETEAKRRSKKEVAFRAMALLAVAVKAEGLEDSILQGFIMHYGVGKHFSPKEMEFIRNPAPSDRDRSLFDWRYEAAWTLLWALGFVDKLDRPSKICDAGLAMGMLSNCGNPAQFIKDGELRPLAEILDQADLIYRYHWAVRNARRSGTPVPEGLDPDIVEERHHTLNWLHQDEEWDNITTDT
jgi:uncharacterized protein DUF4272